MSFLDLNLFRLITQVSANPTTGVFFTCDTEIKQMHTGILRRHTRHNRFPVLFRATIGIHGDMRCFTYRRCDVIDDLDASAPFDHCYPPSCRMWVGCTGLTLYCRAVQPGHGTSTMSRSDSHVTVSKLSPFASASTSASCTPTCWN